jgi:hypothetical protein
VCVCVCVCVSVCYSTYLLLVVLYVHMLFSPTITGPSSNVGYSLSWACRPNCPSVLNYLFTGIIAAPLIPHTALHHTTQHLHTHRHTSAIEVFVSKSGTGPTCWVKTDARATLPHNRRHVIKVKECVCVRVCAINHTPTRSFCRLHIHTHTHMLSLTLSLSMCVYRLPTGQVHAWFPHQDPLYPRQPHLPILAGCVRSGAGTRGARLWG